VVDNGSRDETTKILSRYDGPLRLEVLNESTAGKSRALNRGLDFAEGEVVVVTDDDAIPQPGFLAAWKEAFRREPESSIFGGSIVPLFEAPPAGWMLRTGFHFEELFAARINVPEGPIDPWKIYGPNMAVRRSVFSRGLRFLDNIGPNGADPDYAMGSETEFCLRAQKQGYKLWFAPKPTVQHVVRPHQITPEYCAKRAYRLGRGAALQQWESGILAPRRRSPLFRLAAVPWRAGQRSWLAIRTLRPGAFEHLEARWNYEFYCGFQHEHARQKRLRRETAQMPPR